MHSCTTPRALTRRGLPTAVVAAGLLLGASLSTNTHALSMYSAEAALLAEGVPAGLAFNVIGDEVRASTSGSGVAIALTEYDEQPDTIFSTADVFGMGAVGVADSSAAADVAYTLVPTGDPVDLEGLSFDFLVEVSLTTNDPADQAYALAAAGIYIVDSTTLEILETVFEEILELDGESGFATSEGTVSLSGFSLLAGQGLGIEVAALGVPEPGMLFLLGGGLLALAGSRSIRGLC